MLVSLLVSATDFLKQTERLRTTDPFRTNLLGSVATSVATGHRTYDKYFWWIVTDDEGQVVGAAMRTAPHGMVLSPMPIEAARELATHVTHHDDALPEVAGPTLVVNSFIKAYKERNSTGSLRKIGKSGSQLIYALNKLELPTVKGAMTTANRNNYDLLTHWFADFASETGVNSPNQSEAISDGLRRDSLHFWSVDGEIVSMAGYAPLVETPGGTVGRIGPVYTPPSHRENGYAGALTAELSQQLLNVGAKVMLYTDATNPTSNGVYKRIGFELIGENLSYRFI